VCHWSLGPSFGDGELLTKEPLLGEAKVISCVGCAGFMIGGNKGSLKEGDINPLTGDKLEDNEQNFFSRSTAREIEVWKITFMD